MTIKARIILAGLASMATVAAVAAAVLEFSGVITSAGFSPQQLLLQDKLTPLGKVLALMAGAMAAMLGIHLLLLRSIYRRFGVYVHRNRNDISAVPPSAGDELDPLFDAVRDLLEANRALREKEVSEEQLIAAKRYADNVIASMSDILIVTDPDLRVTTVNNAACEVLEYSQLELVNSPLEHLFKQEPYALSTPLKQLLSQGRMRDTELTYRTRSGRLISALVSASQMRDSAGRIIAIITVGKDITERKQIERDLLEAKSVAEAANRAKSAFVANMSHEIRTPMTAILGFTDLLAQPKLSEPERLNCIETIRRNGRHLLAIINDILDVSKIEAGKMTVERITCSPLEIISDVASLMCGRATDKGLGFDVRYAGPMPATIQSDPTRLRQILMNLLSNAIKFTSTGSVKLMVCLSEETPCTLRFDVVDTGPGLSDQQLAGLFRPFAQADSSTTRRFGGTGLGLMISKRLANMLGGDIVVHSVPGSGSTFSLTLNTGELKGVALVRSPSEYVPAPKTEQSLEATRLMGRVLVAEDGPDNQRLIQYHLSEAGLEVAIAENGRIAVEQAMQAVKEHRPFDLILMDMQMPELDGYSATRQLREAGYRKAIVALTAHAMDSDRERCLAAGCNDFLVKPIEYERFMPMVRRYVQEVFAPDARRDPVEPGTASSESSPHLAPDPTRQKLLMKPSTAKLVVGFVERLDQRLQELRHAIDAQDHTALKTLAHQLKGAAGGYGFPEISRAARTMEDASAADLAAAAATMSELESLARAACEVVRGHVSPS